MDFLLQERLLPGAMAKWFAPGLIRNQDSSWKTDRGMGLVTMSPKRFKQRTFHRKLDIQSIFHSLFDCLLSGIKANRGFHQEILVSSSANEQLDQKPTVFVMKSLLTTLTFLPCGFLMWFLGTRMGWGKSI